MEINNLRLQIFLSAGKSSKRSLDQVCCQSHPRFTFARGCLETLTSVSSAALTVTTAASSPAASCTARVQHKFIKLSPTFSSGDSILFFVIGEDAPWQPFTAAGTLQL